MARIRSVHPGQWTDEDFVQLSMAARLLAIAIRTEADDAGVFEWKPLRLKMRLFPGDDVAIAELLDELGQTNQIMRFDHDGREYGAIRNFAKFQKPKKPSYFMGLASNIPEAVRDYVGIKCPSDRSGPEPVRNQFGTGGEKSRQKGGREEGRKESSVSSLRSETDAEASVDATEDETGPSPPRPVEVVSDPPALPPRPPDPDKLMFDSGIALLGAAGVSEKSARSLLGKLRKQHGTPAVIHAIGAAQRQGAIDPAAFLEGALRHRARDGPATKVTADGKRWEQQNGTWIEVHGG